ncbi:MAG TPA: helical backbone metal receptor [Streptosporangiaceae bacterium]|jgi:ABC-type hemin transport system substrate-binding protein
MGAAARWSQATTLTDDLGLAVTVPPRVRRVVSLVPSLTETVAACAPGLLVGATRWCTHPADLDVSRIGGTKNPDVAGIVALRPDVVLANEEENRQPDLDSLRAAGQAVWVTRIRDLPEALASLRRMITLACRQPPPAWLDAAAAAWQPRLGGAGALGADPAGASGRSGSAGGSMPAGASTAIVPIWRRPWMVLGRDTFAGDLLGRLGVANVYAGHQDRYPRVPLADLRAACADVVILPDEPYRFTASDGPEAFPGSRTALVSGRLLTWYGPSLTDAAAVLRRQLAAARVR